MTKLVLWQNLIVHDTGYKILLKMKGNLCACTGVKKYIHLDANGDKTILAND
jgi:aerobic-type carbon monoxide dehydrogenase small subunit (CoxS/CutS family)